MLRVLLFLGIVGAAAAQAPADLQSLVRDSLRFVEPKKNRADDYTFNFRNERKEFDSDGKIKAHNISTGEKYFQDGFGVFRALERDGKKLTEEELALQQGTIDARLAEFKALSPQERQERRRKSAEEDAWLNEIADALDYKYIGEEPVGGRTAFVLACFPRVGYSPKNMRAKVFTRMKGKLWIDKADRELVRGEAEVFDTVNVGFGFLGRIEKGTRFRMERVRLPDGVWMLDNQTIRFGARVLLVKYIGNEFHMRYWNYRHKSRQFNAELQKGL